MNILVFQIIDLNRFESFDIGINILFFCEIEFDFIQKKSNLRSHIPLRLKKITIGSFYKLILPILLKNSLQSVNPNPTPSPIQLSLPPTALNLPPPFLLYLPLNTPIRLSAEPRAIISHLHHNRVFVEILQLDLDLPLPSVLDCVAQKVHQDLLETLLVVENRLAVQVVGNKEFGFGLLRVHFLNFDYLLDGRV